MKEWTENTFQSSLFAHQRPRATEAAICHMFMLSNDELEHNLKVMVPALDHTASAHLRN